MYLMARPKRLRRLACAPAVDMFFPSGDGDAVAPEDIIVLTMDEFEALRLADLDVIPNNEQPHKWGSHGPRSGESSNPEDQKSHEHLFMGAG